MWIWPDPSDVVFDRFDRVSNRTLFSWFGLVFWAGETWNRQRYVCVEFFYDSNDDFSLSSCQLHHRRMLGGAAVRRGRRPCHRDTRLWVFVWTFLKLFSGPFSLCKCTTVIYLPHHEIFPEPLCKCKLHSHFFCSHHLTSMSITRASQGHVKNFLLKFCWRLRLAFL